MISQSRRYLNQFTALCETAAKLGPISVVSCEFAKAPHFGGFREEMAFPLLLDMAIHQFDSARALLGEDPVAVYCESYNPGWRWFAGDAAATAIFEFPRGAVGRRERPGDRGSPAIDCRGQRSGRDRRLTGGVRALRANWWGFEYAREQ